MAITLIVASCKFTPPKESQNLLDSIKALQGTNYSKFPSVIERYNQIGDSLTAIDKKHRQGLNNYLVESVGNGNDTLLIATQIIIQNPTAMGQWFGDYLAEMAFNAKNSTIDQRSQMLMKQLNIAYFLYKMSGEPSSIKEMETSIDNYINHLDNQRQARLFTLMSSPEELAEEAAESSNDDLLINAIRSAYAEDATLLSRFNTALVKYQREENADTTQISNKK